MVNYSENVRVCQQDCGGNFATGYRYRKKPVEVYTNSGGQLGFIQLTALVAGVQSIKIRRQLGRLAAFILLKKIAHKFNVFTLNL